MTPPDSVAIVDSLRDALRGQGGVCLAYLFGSRARGQARATSDFDIAVLLDEDTARAERGGTIRRLASGLGRAIASELVDLVILNDAPALLRHRVLRDGVLLLQRAPEDRVRFAVSTLREYQDQQIRRQRATRERIHRLGREAHDGRSGDLLEKARRAARLLDKASRVS